jgi:uncharacterized membrane protein YbhN (UPF0104 family)
LPFHHAPWLAARIAIMAGAFAVLRGRLVVECLFLTAIIWTLEGFAVYLLTAAFGIHLAFLALCLVMGAAALSTMFPSAPGYVGSMQIAFAVTFSALALPSGLGVLLATATQILLLGPVTICGLAILLINQLYSGLKMVRARTSRGSVEAGS